MPDETVDGYLGKLYVGDTDDPATVTTWTQLTLLKDYTPPEESLDDLETSHLESPNKTKEYKAGWEEPGEWSANGHFTQTNHAAIRALKGIKRAYRMLFEDDTDAGTHAGGIMFASYIKKIGLPKEAKGLVALSFAGKVSGPITEIAADTTPGP
ncbi:MAG: phage tail tube protein [Planctomycetota bacterium]